MLSCEQFKLTLNVIGLSTLVLTPVLVIELVLVSFEIAIGQLYFVYLNNLVTCVHDFEIILVHFHHSLVILE